MTQEVSRFTYWVVNSAEVCYCAKDPGAMQRNRWKRFLILQSAEDFAPSMLPALVPLLTHFKWKKKY